MIRKVYSDSLFLGNARDAGDISGLYEAEIVAVVDLAWEELPARLPRDLIFCRIPILDGDGNDDATLLLAISIVTILIRQQTRTLVACSAGMSRSPAIAAGALALVTQKEPDGCLVDLTQDVARDVSPILWEQVKRVCALG